MFNFFMIDIAVFAFALLMLYVLHVECDPSQRNHPVFRASKWIAALSAAAFAVGALVTWAFDISL